jgi:ketosteroid isomerase-like protein
MRFVTVQQVRDGKIAAERLYFDQLDFLGQLGIAPLQPAS